MTKINNEIVFVILISYFLKGWCEENQEETKVGVEYTQIFRNMPTLFEYVLDVLQQRVEVLEKDDISAFQETSEDLGAHECENNKVKREAEQCFGNINVDDKANTNKIFENSVESYHAGNKYKRQNNIEALDNVYTTEIHEYSRSNRHKIKYANTDNFNDIERPTHKLVRREGIKYEFINEPFHKHVAEMKNINLNEVKKKGKNTNTETKRNVAEFGKEFAAVDWSEFYLSPKEVEEKAVRTEQMIEDHNNKNRMK